MKIEMELWHLILLLLAFFGCVAAFGKILLDQFEKRLGDKFTAQDTARKEGQEKLAKTFEDHLADERRNSEALQTLEREFLKFQAALPLHYVRREDYVRGQAILEAKQDALYNKQEVILLELGQLKKGNGNA